MHTQSLPRWFLYAALALVAATACPAAQPGPAEVTVSQPVTRTVTDYADFTGRTEAVNTVVIRPRVSGYLVAVRFKDGAEVKQGELLFEIDPRPYQAELERTRARLALAKARLTLADVNAKRARALAANNGMSRADLDKTLAERAAAEAEVGLATADDQTARLMLDFTKVQAPVAGHIGRRLLDPGNVVKADETALAKLVSRDPMYVYFDLDERTVLRLRRAINQGNLKPTPGGVMPLLLGLPSEQGYPHRGTVDFVNNQLDPQTGTLRMRGVFANPQPLAGTRLFSPGMFARVRLAVGAPYKALLVTEQAVLKDKDGAFVWVVSGDKDVAEKRRVSLGAAHQGLRVVAQGLRPEDRIIVGGLNRLKSGMTVRPRVVPMPGLEMESPAAVPRARTERP